MNYKIEQTRLQIFKRDRWRCVVCKEHINIHNSPQLAHKIPAKKHYIAKYTKEVIHHPLNMGSTCCLAHNAKLDINGHTARIDKLVEEIRLDIEKNTVYN